MFDPILKTILGVDTFSLNKSLYAAFFVMDQQNNAPAEICGNSMKTKLAFVSFKSTSSTMMI